jgi:hypothetical protein
MRLVSSLLFAFLPGLAMAQDHAAHHSPASGATQAGQGAFAAIREIVMLLEADPATDWSRVNLEALRRHLVTMDRVLMQSEVAATLVPGGIQLDVTGAGDVARAITEMVGTHSEVLDREPGLRSLARPLPDGIRLTVTAEDPGDARQVARIRGLGFAGLLATGDHHTAHHLALARGEGGKAHH